MRSTMSLYGGKESMLNCMVTLTQFEISLHKQLRCLRTSLAQFENGGELRFTVHCNEAVLVSDISVILFRRYSLLLLGDETPMKKQMRRVAEVESEETEDGQ
jgi:hypothetical protein